MNEKGRRRGWAVGAVCICAAALAGATAAAPPEMTVVAGGGVAGFADGVGSDARFNKPIRLAPFGPDAVLVADIFNHAIRSVSKNGRVRTIAGSPDRKGHEDGPAATARFASPHGVGTAPDGRIAVAEAEGQTLRLLTPTAGAAGRIAIIAGVEGQAGSDGSHLNRPAAVLVHAGWLWIADLDNHRICAVPLGTGGRE